MMQPIQLVRSGIPAGAIGSQCARNVVAGNIANANTPKYQAEGRHAFRKRCWTARMFQMARTNPAPFTEQRRSAM
jgi:flagellar basal body rod protein FlgB